MLGKRTKQNKNGRWTKAHKLIRLKSGSQATTEYALNHRPRSKHSAMMQWKVKTKRNCNAINFIWNDVHRSVTVHLPVRCSLCTQWPEAQACIKHQTITIKLPFSQFCAVISTQPSSFTIPFSHFSCRLVGLLVSLFWFNFRCFGLAVKQ